MNLRSTSCIGSTALLLLFAITPALAQSVPGRWTQTWADEFNHGDEDLAGWSYETGNGGWGNHELENYTKDPANASVKTVDGIGALHLKAIVSKTGEKTTYTSARLTTRNLFSQTYGLIEFRAKFPAGQGLWPAMWMMPKDSVYGDWPRSGEIDVFESRDQDPKLVQGSLHSGHNGGSGHVCQTQKFGDTKLQPANFSTGDWHTYDIQWKPGTADHAATLTWYVDGVAYETQTGGWPTPVGVKSKDAPFDQPFYVILNMAVGGDYVGKPNLKPGEYDMQVDYVRAYKQAEK